MVIRAPSNIHPPVTRDGSGSAEAGATWCRTRGRLARRAAAREVGDGTTRTSGNPVDRLRVVDTNGKNLRVVRRRGDFNLRQRGREGQRNDRQPVLFVIGHHRDVFEAVDGDAFGSAG